GVGFGGSCFPKDLKALIEFSRLKGCSPGLLEEVLKVNEHQPLKAVELAEKRLGDLKGKVVAVLGLSFKPGTDDLREAPSLKIIEALLSRGATVKAYDPAAVESARKKLEGRVELCASKEECVKDADCCIVVTEWDEFKELSPGFFKELMRRPLVVDGRRIYDPKLFKRELEFEAVGLGVQP
ncbi:MAG: UDP-glucose 6-dehydrogenase, partial [Thermoprotei archaeon]